MQEAIAQAAAAWRNLSTKQKLPFEKQAEELQKAFTAKWREWVARQKQVQQQQQQCKAGGQPAAKKVAMTAADRVENDETLQQTAASQQQVVQDERWAQCESCNKWRKIPTATDAPDFDADAPFFCADNKWDPKRRDCHTPEEQWEEALLTYEYEVRCHGTPDPIRRTKKRTVVRSVELCYGGGPWSDGG